MANIHELNREVRALRAQKDFMGGQLMVLRELIRGGMEDPDREDIVIDVIHKTLEVAKPFD